MIRPWAAGRALVGRCDGAAAGVVARGAAAAVAAAAVAATVVTVMVKTAAAARRGGVGAVAAAAVLPARLVGGEALDDAVARQHAAVDAEVAADHEGAHGRVLLRQHVRLVGQIRLVLAAVDEHEARVASGVPVALVHGVHPSAAPAEAYNKKGQGFQS